MTWTKNEGRPRAEKENLNVYFWYLGLLFSFVGCRSRGNRGDGFKLGRYKIFDIEIFSSMLSLRNSEKCRRACSIGAARRYGRGTPDRSEENMQWRQSSGSSSVRAGHDKKGDPKETRTPKKEYERSGERRRGEEEGDGGNAPNRRIHRSGHVRRWGEGASRRGAEPTKHAAPMAGSHTDVEDSVRELEEGLCGR